MIVPRKPSLSAKERMDGGGVAFECVRHCDVTGAAASFFIWYPMISSFFYSKILVCASQDTLLIIPTSALLSKSESHPPPKESVIDTNIPRSNVIRF